MLLKRLIVCLDVDHGRVVKGTGFQDLRDVGDPVELADRYQHEGADEIVFLDISASAEGRATLLDVVRRTAERLFVPLTVGGGISTVADVDAALRAGADKVAMNTAAVERPELITAAASRFGRQCVVVSIDARLEAENGTAGYRVYTRGGNSPTGLDALSWAVEAEERGAGEVLVTSIDRDGGRMGYDLDLTAGIARTVGVPVVASGGAGSAAHVRDALTTGRADAALVAGIFHDGTTSVAEVKRVLAGSDIAIREVWS